MPFFGHAFEIFLPHRQSMTHSMAMTCDSAQLFPAAKGAVIGAVTFTGDRVVDVHPLADLLARDFPRHSRAEICAAVVTAVALSGATVRWRAPLPAARHR